ncbi:MAG: heme-binding protein [Gammaproteobacteria bacterium]|nr:heme-binding protein [Gammaproteobacteria bacterium]
MKKTLQQQTVHWQAAQAAVSAAQEKAAELGLRVSASVSDRGGNAIAFLRHPAAPLHTSDIAADKAITAASFGFPTRDWMAFIESQDSAGLRAGIVNRDRLVVFGGGLPLYLEGELVGGVGVSGGSEEQDEICARAGVAAAGFSVKA